MKSLTVKEIAEKIDPHNSKDSRLRQRIRDQIKRQNIKYHKHNRHLEIAEKDANIIIKKLQPEQKKNYEKLTEKALQDRLQESSRKIKNLEEILDQKNAKIEEQKTEIYKLNNKISSYADQLVDFNKVQQKLTAQGQELERRTQEIVLKNQQLQRKVITSENKLEDSKSKQKLLEDKVQKVKRASFWQRLRDNFWN